MGERVEFHRDGTTARGYLAPAQEGAGLGVVVIAESGLVDHIVDVCDRFAAEGFTAFAPDRLHPESVRNREVDEASGAAMAADLERAAHDLSGAVDFLQGHSAVRGRGVGVVGFRLGGGLALLLAALRPDEVRAVVPFCGIAPGGSGRDWSALTAAVEGHYAEHDHLATPEAVSSFDEQLRELGKEVRVFSYPGTGPNFFDDTRPETYDDDAARQAWVRTLEFLRAKLG